MDRYPINCVAEYRGRSAAGEFVRNGEKVEYAGRAKFEYRWSDGEPDTMEFTISSFDRTAQFDVAALAIGALVHIEATSVHPARDAGPDARSYVRLRGATLLSDEEAATYRATVYGAAGAPHRNGRAKETAAA